MPARNSIFPKNEFLVTENMTKFCAFIVTFNRPHILKNTIDAIFNQTQPPQFILVVDNGDDPEMATLLQTYSADKIGYHSMGENAGPPGAIAYGIQWAYENNYQWVYWGDDDDPPQTPDTLERLLNLIKQKDDSKIAGVGAVGVRWNWQKGELERLADSDLHDIVKVDMIAGGQHFILRSDMAEKVGLPNKDLFFGLDDLEYCLRLQQAGYHLYIDGDLMKEYRHLAGRLNIQQRRAIIPTAPQNTLWRRYYSTRNYIFMMRNVFHRSDLAHREMAKSLIRCLTAWQRGIKFGITFNRYQLGGIIDGYLGRMGRTILPIAKVKTNFRQD